MNQQTKSLLIANDLAKSYGKREIIKKVSLSIRSGDIVGLLGPNGAGKTTLFYMISGLVQPNNGSVFIDQTEITNYPIHKRSRLGIGYLPQESSIFGKMRVEDNIDCVLETHNNYGDRKNRLEELISDFGLNHIRKSLGYQLSGGERRRVEIARALAANPKFILLDEPFAGVDPISINDTKKIITSLVEKNIGVIITDHNVHDTLSICNYIYIISNGYFLAEDSPEEIVKNEQVKKAYLGHNFNLNY